MADPLADTMNYLTNGTIAGVPVIAVIFMGILVFVVIYMIASRGPKQKLFKPMDLKKETKRRMNREYGFFKIDFNNNIYDVNMDKPFGYVLGYMRVVWCEQFKRYEPIYVNTTAPNFAAKAEKVAMEVYQKPLAELNDIQKKNVNEISKEELRYDKTEVVKVGDDSKIVRGKREVSYIEPVPMYCLKIAKPDFLHRIVAELTNMGTTFFLFDAKQLCFEKDRITVASSLSRTQFQDQFVFSESGKKLLQDVGFGVEREDFMGAVANSIERVLFNNDMAKDINIRREDAKIEGNKYKHQKESNE